MKINNLVKISSAMLVAVALCVLGLTSAFKTDTTKDNKRPYATTTMYYHGASFSQSDVQNKSNWNTSPQDCPVGSSKACQVTVDNSLVSGGAFISTVSLQAPSGSTVPLTDVKNNGISANPQIVNRQ